MKLTFFSQTSSRLFHFSPSFPYFFLDFLNEEKLMTTLAFKHIHILEIQFLFFFKSSLRKILHLLSLQLYFQIVWKMSSTKALIEYFIPEDGDVLEHPNVYTIPKKIDSITLGDIIEVSLLLVSPLVIPLVLPHPRNLLFPFQECF